jgi:hypothetical protein
MAFLNFARVYNHLKSLFLFQAVYAVFSMCFSPMYLILFTMMFYWAKKDGHFSKEFITI